MLRRMSGATGVLVAYCMGSVLLGLGLILVNSAGCTVFGGRMSANGRCLSFMRAK